MFGYGAARRPVHCLLKGGQFPCRRGMVVRRSSVQPVDLDSAFCPLGSQGRGGGLLVTSPRDGRRWVRHGRSRRRPCGQGGARSPCFGGCGPRERRGRSPDGRPPDRVLRPHGLADCLGAWTPQVSARDSTISSSLPDSASGPGSGSSGASGTRSAWVPVTSKLRSRCRSVAAADGGSARPAARRRVRGAGGGRQFHDDGDGRWWFRRRVVWHVQGVQPVYCQPPRQPGASGRGTEPHGGLVRRGAGPPASASEILRIGF